MHSLILCRSLPPLDLEYLPPSSTSHGLPCLRIKAARLLYQPYADLPQPANPAPCPHQRLHEIVMRVGEICLSPDLAHAVLFPSHAAGHTFNDEDIESPVSSLPPDIVLAAMDVGRAPCQLRQADEFFARFLQHCLPTPVFTTSPTALHLLAWRVETPARACVFTGQHPKYITVPAISSAFAPHTLSKALLEDRSRRKDPSCIHLIPASTPASPDAIRASLLHHAQTALTPHHERVRNHPSPILDTTLDEFFACTIHAPARNHTDITLHQSPPWDKDHIDSRSARHAQTHTSMHYS